MVHTSRDGAQFTHNPILDVAVDRRAPETSADVILNLPVNTITKFVKVRYSSCLP